MMYLKKSAQNHRTKLKSVRLMTLIIINELMQSRSFPGQVGDL